MCVLCIVKLISYGYSYSFLWFSQKWHVWSLCQYAKTMEQIFKILILKFFVFLKFYIWTLSLELQHAPVVGYIWIKLLCI